MREWVRGGPVMNNRLQGVRPEGARASRRRAKPDIVAISLRGDHARSMIHDQLADYTLASVTLAAKGSLLLSAARRRSSNAQPSRMSPLSSHFS